jgi:hypothetical protein
MGDRMALHQMIYDLGRDIDAEDFIMVMIISSAEKIVSEFKDIDEQKVIIKAFYDDLRRITRQMTLAVEEAEKFRRKAH